MRFERRRAWGWIGVVMALLGVAPVAAQEGATVSGAVWDEVGLPVRGAEVAVGRGGRVVATDESGRFVVRGVAPGRHSVRVAAPGYGTESREVAVGAGGAEVVLTLRRTPLQLPGLRVMAAMGGREAGAVAQATSYLSGRSLEREMAPTLAQTLRSQPGIAMRSMGPAATMPVMRGLSGDRILVLQDGQRSGDLAGSADDHGVTIDPLTAQRVEVIRGPATLLYGNNALGGVVNVVTADIPTQRPTRGEWLAGAQTESAYPGASASARTTQPLGEHWAMTLRAGGRSTDEMRIPGDPLLGDRLANTQMRNATASAGIGYVGESLVAGSALKGYRFAYGLPGPPGSDPVSLRGGRVEVTGRSEWEPRGGPLASMRLDATAQEYAHDELDDRAGSILQSFQLRTGTLNLLARQGTLGPLSSGAWGASVLVKRYAATGPAALTPAADSRGVGVFGFQELALPGGAALEMGGRYDRYRIESHAAERFGPGVQRDFRALSGSLGARVPLGGGVSAAASVARSFRAPTVEEMFSNAAHAGTGAVEVGNPALEAERGLAVEAVLRVQNARWNGQFAAYRNEIDGYVHLVALGDTVVYGAVLPVLSYGQARATLRGLEGSLEWAATREVVLGVMGDYLHAGLRDGTPLSFMPPPRVGGSARWERSGWSLGGEAHHELRQDRVGAADELPTPAHTVLRLHAGYRFRAGGLEHSVTARAENLTDELHREATSRIKDFAPGPGRNLALLYRIVF